MSEGAPEGGEGSDEGGGENVNNEPPPESEPDPDNLDGNVFGNSNDEELEEGLFNQRQDEAEAKQKADKAKQTKLDKDLDRKIGQQQKKEAQKQKQKKPPPPSPGKKKKKALHGKTWSGSKTKTSYSRAGHPWESSSGFGQPHSGGMPEPGSTHLGGK